MKLIANLKDVIDNESEFIKLCSQWTNPKAWQGIKAHDLYFWIDILNVFDSHLESP